VFRGTASALFGVSGLRFTDADPVPGSVEEMWVVTDCEGAAACQDCGRVPRRVHDEVVTRPKDMRRAGTRWT